MWWAFLRLTDPGYLGDDEGLARRTISTVVTVLGYVLFLGLLIAILTQWLNQLIARLESGVTPVALSDHVLSCWAGAIAPRPSFRSSSGRASGSSAFSLAKARGSSGS